MVSIEQETTHRKSLTPFWKTEIDLINIIEKWIQTAHHFDGHPSNFFLPFLPRTKFLFERKEREKEKKRKKKLLG